jgi:hypothetical protein
MGKTNGSKRVAEIVVKLYEMRDFVKRVNTPDDYLAMVRDWAGRIRQQMASAGQDEMHAMMSLLGQHQHSTFGAWIQAAYVEMTEGCLVDDGNQRGDAMGADPAMENSNERSESEMDQERVDGAELPKDDGEPKIIRVFGRLEKITMPTERGKELQLAVVLANNGDNRLALAMMDGASVAIEAVERDETPKAKPTAPGECDDQLPLFDMDGDPEEGDGEVGEEEIGRAHV